MVMTWWVRMPLTCIRLPACVQYPVTCTSWYASICEVPHKSIACPVSPTKLEQFGI
jgi:hypothetical protein